MEQILNKKYIRKNSINSDIFIPININDQDIHFSNGAIGNINSFMNDFEEYKEQITESLELDPNSFFNTPTNDQKLLNDVESIAKNPSAKIGMSQKYQEELQNQPSFLNYNNTNNNTEDTEINYTVQENTSILNKVKPSNRLPEYDVFDRIKKSEEIEILIPFTIKLPRAEKIDAINDMFETSLTDYLSKMYIEDNISKNSKKLQKLIKDSIEEWVEKELYSNKKPRKVRKNKVQEVEKVQVEKVQEENIPIIDDISVFTTPIKKWDKDLKKLFVITTEEQFIEVEKEYNRLKDNNIINVDFDKYEDMIFQYKNK